MSDSLGGRLGTTQTQDYVLLALLALGGYVIYQIVQGVKATGAAVGAAASAVGRGVQTAYTTTTDALGSGLYSLFGPDDAKALGSMTYLMVNFPDGLRHSVPANTVNASGLFTWTGYPPGSQPPIVLTLMKDANGAWYATSDTPMAIDPKALQPVVFDPSVIDSNINVN